MSNRIKICPTEFTDIRTGVKSYGIRMFDDYDESYDDSWDTIPVKDLDIIKRVIEVGDKTITAMIDYVIEHQQGICVGENWYDWDEIKHLFENEE